MGEPTSKSKVESNRKDMKIDLWHVHTLSLSLSSLSVLPPIPPLSKNLRHKL